MTPSAPGNWRNATSTGGQSDSAHRITRAELAQTAPKDTNWKDALSDVQHRGEATCALGNELASREATILTEVEISVAAYAGAIR